MTHQIHLQTDSNAFFEHETAFQTVIIRKIKYTDPNDTNAIVVNLIYGPFGAKIANPISQAFSAQQSELNIIQMAKNFDEPFDHSFNQLDIQLELNFKSKSTGVSFELELG